MGNPCDRTIFDWYEVIHYATQSTWRIWRTFKRHSRAPFGDSFGQRGGEIIESIVLHVEIAQFWDEVDHLFGKRGQFVTSHVQRGHVRGQSAHSFRRFQIIER